MELVCWMPSSKRAITAEPRDRHQGFKDLVIGIWRCDQHKVTIHYFVMSSFTKASSTRVAGKTSRFNDSNVLCGWTM